LSQGRRGKASAIFFQKRDDRRGLGREFDRFAARNG
jgi:hypothetical protein